ncbi:SCO family protein [Paludisphaera mucosa]|uniref:SCO family protein n=1 Tax=Paludisphaera mucosa TaxID=3030827 RepID=A0ABT6FLE8_9BACT|nr:SCO family protein [Paludisphaera mucosa]MDG3008185.1 SCO family protein [Paludisphaera mucosa]
MRRPLLRLMMLAAPLLAAAPAVGDQPVPLGTQAAPVSDPAAFAGTASQVKFEQRLGAQVPLGTTFLDEEGRETPLSACFGRRPVVLALVFHRCPLLCNQVLAGLTRSLKPLPIKAGVDFDVVAVSIDPDDTPASAKAKKAGYLERYDNPGTEAGWKFLTGRKEAIDALCDAVGFHYVQNPATKQFAHAAGIVVMTPGGQPAQYFFGIDFPPKEVDAAIRRASEGHIGSRIASLLLLCYDYDSATGKYTLSIVRLLRGFGTLTALSLGLYLFLMFRRELRGRTGDGPPDVAEATAGDGPGA